MRKAAVTGATGFLGRNLVEQLADDGWSVTALVRDPERARQLLPNDVDCRRVDLVAPRELDGALAGGFEALFHTAADTSTWSREAERQWRVNVEGTRNLLAAARRHAVGRLIHVSSTSVYGHHEGTVTEASEQLARRQRRGYAASKAAAEMLVREACGQGIDAVIVNPTHVIGRYDSRNWARLIQMVADGSLPAIPPGGGDFAHGPSVTRAMITAHERGRSGTNYILGGPHASFRTFIDIAAEQLGVRVRAPAPPALLIRAIAGIGALTSAVTGGRPRLTPEEAAFACEDLRTDWQRARSELDYTTPGLEAMVAESIEWQRAEGLLPVPPTA